MTVDCLLVADCCRLAAVDAVVVVVGDDDDRDKTRIDPRCSSSFD